MALIFLLLTPFSVFSQTQGEKTSSELELHTLKLAYYWSLKSEAKALLPYLKNALSDDRKYQIFGESDLKTRLREKILKTPPCFLGKQECTTPFSMAMKTFDLSGLAKIEASKKGFNILLFDARKVLLREIKIEEKDPKGAAYLIISKLFDATGTVVFISKPAGAELSIDGEKKGKTPFHMQRPIGEFKYSLRLQNYNTVEGKIVLRNGEINEINAALKPRLSTLTILNAPQGAEVFINGSLIEKGEASIDLEPGTYSIQVRKEGYDSFLETIEMRAGDKIERTMTMEKLNPLLRDISVDAIAHRHFILRLAYEHGYQNSSLRDAHSRRHTFLGLAKGNRLSDIQEGFHTNGIRLEFLYQARNFGISIASLSLLSGSLDFEGIVLDKESLRSHQVQLSASNRFQFRPFQLNYRYFFENFVPSVELGMGIDMHFFNASDGGEFPLSFQRTEAFWTLGVVGQYFISNSFFGVARYSFQDYFAEGLGVEHQLSIGLGLAFGTIFSEPEPPSILPEGILPEGTVSEGGF